MGMDELKEEELMGVSGGSELRDDMGGAEDPQALGRCPECVGLLKKIAGVPGKSRYCPNCDKYF